MDVQEDLPEAWSLGSTLTMIGLGSFAPTGTKPAPVVIDPEIAKEMFTKL